MEFTSTLPWEARVFLVRDSLFQDCELREKNEIVSSSNEDRIDAGGLAVGGLSLDHQAWLEKALIDDLITALRGAEGIFIKARTSTKSEQHHVEFYIPGSIPGHFKQSAEKILRLCSDRFQVQQFAVYTQSYTRGRVSHALGRQLFAVIQELDFTVTTVESRLRIDQRFLLSEMKELCQPFLDLFKVLASLLYRAREKNLMGALLLNLVTEEKKFFPRDDTNFHQNVLYALWKAGCQPYTEMLERWLYEGILDDPFNEFMVEKNESVNMEGSLYWEKCYQIRPLCVPDFLQGETERILTTGKCLTAIRECGRTSMMPFPGSSETCLSNAKDEVSYMECIQIAYKWSSAKMLHLMTAEFELMARLQSVRHCFLLDQSDFIHDFMDSASDELGKWKDAVSKRTLASMLDHALRTSLCNGDPFHGDITFTLDFKPIFFQMEAVEEYFGNRKEVTEDGQEMACRGEEYGAIVEQESTLVDGMDSSSGWDAFTLDYKVPWPISLVVSEQSLVVYRVIFRHLFSCLSTKRQLERGHLGNSMDPKMRNWNCLGQRMLQLLRSIEYHCMRLVLEPNWRSMESQLQAASSIDEVIVYHNSFLHRCFQECLLHHHPYLLKLKELRSTCLEYANAHRGLDNHSKLSKLRQLEDAFAKVWIGLREAFQTEKEPSASNLMQIMQEVGKGLPEWMQES